MTVKELKYYLDELSKTIEDFDNYQVDISNTDEDGREHLDWLEQIKVLDHKIVLYRDDECYVCEEGIYPIINEKGDNFYE